MWPRKRIAWLIALLLLLLGLPLSGVGAQSDKSYQAERFDVAAAVAEDGSLLVTETVEFRFMGGPFTYVFRELPVDHTDGITAIVARVDGRTLPPGAEAGQVEIDGRNPIRVTWHLEPTVDAQRTFELSYRMLGVARQDAGADRLDWQPLPDEYDYFIRSSRVTLDYPLTAELLESPAVLAGQARLAADAGRALFELENLNPNDPLVVRLRFAPGSLISAPPAWQARQQQQAQWGWVWAALGGLLLAVGTVGTWLQTRPYRHRVVPIAGSAYAPPADLPPALAGLLRSSGANAAWSHALGTLFDLADRGFLMIEDLPKEKWYQSHDFLVRQAAPARDLRPHEQALLDLLFETKSGARTDEILFSKLGGLISSKRWQRYVDVLRADLKAEGFFSPERERLRKRLLTLGVVLLLGTAVVIFPLMFLFFDLFGAWPLLLLGGAFLLAMILLIAGAALSLLTDAGAAAKAAWEPFYRFLQSVTRGKAGVTQPEMFAEYLPFAAAFGLAHAWARRFEKTGWTEVPAYFHTLQAADSARMGAFVAMTSASSSAGGSAAGAAGAAGAGAAGGGASGAG